MDLNRLDIARKVGERALNSDSGSEADDEDSEPQSQTGAVDADQVTAARCHRYDGLNQNVRETATFHTASVMLTLRFFIGTFCTPIYFRRLSG